MVKQTPEPTIRALSKYLKIDDRDALEEVYRLYKELYQPVPHPSPAAIQTQLTWMAERIHEQKPPNRNSSLTEQF